VRLAIALRSAEAVSMRAARPTPSPAWAALDRSAVQNQARNLNIFNGTSYRSTSAVLYYRCRN